ncbi:hypothetical protein B0T18DRAFT_57606 [Schizothecium vesticola]|uniref:Uncharacterized protein n=1 Tax=Schizothecium vesticola TaxID=314040 RepID=A0AA40F4H3_9PEZI|nr:hypothetical protein B0T18DRAFT_57606 [Schizothecium vesticola]
MPGTKRQQPGQDNATPPKKHRPQPDMTLILYFACHFFVRSPLEFPDCHPWVEGPDGETRHNMFKRPADLTQHHKRNHAIPPHCSRCLMVFGRADEVQNHARTDTLCDVVPSAPLVGVTIQQLDEMARAPRGMSAKRRWFRDYAITFPMEPVCTRSPYATPERHIIDIFIQHIQSMSIPNVPQSTLDAVCHDIQSRRLISRAKALPPFHPEPAPASAAPQAVVNVEVSAQVGGGPIGEGKTSGATSEEENAQLGPLPIRPADHTEAGPSYVQQDFAPTDTVDPANLILRYEVADQEVPVQNPSMILSRDHELDDDYDDRNLVHYDAEHDIEDEHSAWST